MLMAALVQKDSLNPFDTKSTRSLRNCLQAFLHLQHEVQNTVSDINDFSNCMQQQSIL